MSGFPNSSIVIRHFSAGHYRGGRLPHLLFFIVKEITRLFLAAHFPRWLQSDLELFVRHAAYPLAVRSSSLLEDAQFQPFAGIYKTYMLPNLHPYPNIRLERLILAIKLVYASTYYQTPKSFARSTFHRLEDEKMAVVIQRLSGTKATT